MAKQQQVVGFEVNPKFVGALLTEQVDNLLRVFCFYLNGEVGSFDLPAQENLDNLRHFFTRLNMDETCFSLINDEVVQGRFYVHAGDEDKYWLYTLLSSPGNTMPVNNVAIFNLPWRVCWRSQEAEVLECGKPGESEHCFAIRTFVSADDAGNLLKQSKAFLNPIVVQSRRSRKNVYLSVGIGLVLLAVPMAVTFFCLHKSAANVFPSQPEPVVARVHPAAPAGEKYYLLCNHQITGPYPMKVIKEMQLSGKINAEAMVRAENSTEWAGLAEVLPLQTSD